MRWLLAFLAIVVCLGCTNPRAAYLNATDAFDSDFRRMIKELDRFREADKLDWQMLERISVANIDRLRHAQKTFSQGPPGSDAMRTSAQDLIVKLVPPMMLLHDRATKVTGTSLSSEERENLLAMRNTAALALEVYDMRRKEFSGG